MNSNNTKRVLIPIAIVALVFISAYFIQEMFRGDVSDTPNDVAVVNNFNDCVAEGNLVMESYPRQCRSTDGRLFVEDIGDFLDKMDLVNLTYPMPGETISSPVEIHGEARGFWYFEADFPVLLLDSEGDVVSEGIATAQDEWMTEEFVPFVAELSFPASLSGQEGSLVLKKDNPSGLEEHDDSFTIPVIFE